MTLSFFMIELEVANWPAMVAWYRDVLGLEVLSCHEADRFALLRAGSGRIALKQGIARPGSPAVVFETEHLEAELERLKKHDVCAVGSIKDSPEGYRSVHVSDPEGHRIGLFEWSGAPPSPGVAR